MKAEFRPMQVTTLVAALVIGLYAPFLSADETPKQDARLIVKFTSESGVDLPLLPCRVYLLDDANKPIRPEKFPFWKDHFVCEGGVELKLPAGKYTVQLERGPEYERLQRTFDLEPGETGQYVTAIRRIANLREQGWISGDLHVHRPVEDIHRLMQAEDLDVAPVITWWNNRNLWADQQIPEKTTRLFDNCRIYDVMAGEDEREGGALLFFGLKQPLPITGASREYPSPMKFVEMAREQNPDVWIDIEKPFWWDVPVWLACANVDSIGIANNHMCRGTMYETEAWGKPRDADRLPAPRGNGFWSQEIYYHILNCGLRIPPSAGSASGVLPNPVGYNRVYVYMRSESNDPAENMRLWWNGLKSGRSFVTNGPLLNVLAEGHRPGHVFHAEAGQQLKIPIEIELTSVDEIQEVEIIRNGIVAQKLPVKQILPSNAPGYGRAFRLGVPRQTLTLKSLDFDSSGWFLVRAIANDQRTFRFASTAPFYVEIGDVKNRVSKQSASFFLDWVNERYKRVGDKLKDPAQLREVLSYHDRARTFWQDIVNNANAE